MQVADELDNITAKYAYDANGRRISKTANNAATTTIWDGWSEIQEFSGGAAAWTHVNGASFDENLFAESAFGAYYYHEDASGSIYAKTTYAPAGPGGPSGAALAGNIGGYTAFRLQMQNLPDTEHFYMGRKWDDETRTYYFRHRNYNEKMGRFLTRDPQEVYTYYMYAQNNPLFYTDPMGLFLPFDHKKITKEIAELSDVSTNYINDYAEYSTLNDSLPDLKYWQPAHYMRNQGMTINEARTLSNLFVSDWFKFAVDSCNNSDIESALLALGLVTHTEEDKAVKVHGIEKYWLPYNPGDIVKHFLYETHADEPSIIMDMEKAKWNLTLLLKQFRTEIDECKCKMFQ